MKQALQYIRYAFWPALVLAPWLVVLTWVPPTGVRPPLGNPIFTYFLAFVLVVGVILSVILRHLIQRSKRQAAHPAKIYTFMEEVLRTDPTAERLHEAGLFCFEAGEWERAITYLARVGPEALELYRSARYHLLLALLELGRFDEASRLQGELPADFFTSDQRYNIALAYKKHAFLARAKEQFLKLFLMDIGFRDVSQQLQEIGDMERSRRLAPAYAFLDGAISERYSDLAVREDRGQSVVCEALDRDLGRQVVLRALKPEHADEGAIDAFLSEARALAAWDHPCILKVYDIRKDRLPYFCVESFDGRSLPELAGAPLPERVEWLRRLVDLAEKTGGFEPARVLANDRGELRLASMPAAPATVPYAFLAQLAAPGGPASPVIEHAAKGLQMLLEAGASTSEIRRGVDVLDTVLRLDAEERERTAVANCVRWLEHVHRHWIHGLKSKFSVIKRFPGEPSKAVSIFGREANLLEVDKMLAALEEQTRQRPAMPARAVPELTALLEQVERLELQELRGQVARIAQLSEGEAGRLLSEVSERFVGLSVGIARFLETLEVDLAQLVELVSRGAGGSAQMVFEEAGEAGWTVRTARPEELRHDLKTILEDAVHNAVEAGAQAVTFGLFRGGDRRYVAVVVEDDGPGLPEGLAERLARERYSTKPGGTGTGLSTSMHLAERHGGVLAVANRSHGRGARVEINLPTMAE
ncbi:MAG: hypothetical protein HYY25_09520 [Candidatus Wallbacteria bacterium]|nr:hypothetical protein [Candidatus Wallbacteria bacterium]